MQFLRTLLWVFVAVLLAILASGNWRDVTLDLWGGLQVTIKLPFLLLLTFLAGMVPTWLVMRGKYWRLERRASTATPVPPPPAAPVVEDDPAR